MRHESASLGEQMEVIGERTGSLESRDGTKVSFVTVGAGPAVIVVPGALSVAAEYAAFARALAEHFTVHTIERRGRGLSGPQGDDYSVDKEVSDVLALQSLTGATFLVGHSFGGLVALEAARRNQSLAKMALYEPAVSIDGSIPTAWMAACETKLGERKDLEAFAEFTRVLGPDRGRNTPRWLMRLILLLVMGSDERRRRLSLLAEGLREHREVARLDNSYPNYREVTAGVLLMYGGRTDTSYVTLAIERLATVLPQSETKGFRRLDHFGIDQKAPQEVAHAVIHYFQR
jgi:pimeloyl-ACP methyl ester carboxylesterase